MGNSIISTATLMSLGSFQGSAPDIPWIRIALVMILCIFLAFAAVGFLRIRYGLPFLPDRLTNPITSAGIVPDPAQEKLAIINRLATGPSSQIIVLARDEQRYLLHISQSGATVIDRYTVGTTDSPASHGDAK
ncbi:hypothetical protein [uncultured Erythrobacter sp.]|uniref:hypothetical protein n=1 Tax=uncultured Erythrobacter sp. TaxID=263913 RepID=UPI00261D125E|nr:hypothetical protein [uncultured Erythrobacter sp.]